MQNKHRYTEAWNDTIRPAILKRDNYKCRECGIGQRAYVIRNVDGSISEITIDQFVVFRHSGKKVYRIYLQVAHLDNVPENMDESNLITLCPSCHLKRDSEFKQILRKSRKAEVVNSLGATPLK